MDLYILSIWNNHESPKAWFFDVCPKEQYFKNSFNYVLKYKKPYAYTPIYIGSYDACHKLADELTEKGEFLENKYLMSENIN